MPRPENHIDIQAGPIAVFAAGLRELRGCAEPVPTYRQLAARAHFSVTALSQAAAGRKLPSWEVTEAFVAACEGDLQEWRERWEQALDAVDHSTEGNGSSPPSAPAPPATLSPPSAGRRLAPIERGEPGSIDPAEAQSSSELLRMLNLYRIRARVSLRELEARSKADTTYPAKLSRTTLSSLLRATGRPPDRSDVLQIVALCGGSPAELEAWAQAWEWLHRPPATTRPAPSAVELIRTTTLTERDLVTEADQQEARSHRTVPHLPAPRPKAANRRELILAATAVVVVVATVILSVLNLQPPTPSVPTVTIGHAAVLNTGTFVNVLVTYRCTSDSAVTSITVSIASVSGARGRTAALCDGIPHTSPVTAATVSNGTLQKGDVAVVSASLVNANNTVSDAITTLLLWGPDN